MAVAAALEQIQTYREPRPLPDVSVLLMDMFAAEPAECLPLEDITPPTESVRPPETEIYGRSLSTIHKLGTLMVGKVASEVVRSPEAVQARAEFYTSVEEGFGTDMELGGGLEVRDFDPRPVMSGKVMAKDFKTAISDMTEAGLVCAESKVKAEKAQKDYRFVPQLIRSKWDHDNALLVDAMTRNETGYNTRIVVSPFPEEAAAKSGSEYWRDIGYVPHLQRGFVQLYHANGEGLISGSLSFDGSNKEKLRELFKRHKVEIPEEEVTDNWLRYAITDTLSEEAAKALAIDIANEAGDPRYKKMTNTVDITGNRHKVMDMVFDESYVHACESLAQGRQTPGVRELVFQLADKAESFNDRYAQSLYAMRTNADRFTDDDMIVLHELLVYSTIEMMRGLYTGSMQPTTSDVSDFSVRGCPNAGYLQSLDPAAFQGALAGFGAEGARNNRTYSACGLSISLGNTTSSNENPQDAFGGNADRADAKLADEDKYGSREFNCPKCKRANRRPRNKLIPNCQKCGADVTCG